MKYDLIEAQIREYVQREFNVPEDDPDFSNEVNLFDYGYIDSFGAVSLTTFLESTFQIAITERDLGAYPLTSIKEFAMFIGRRLEGAL
jgi:D-alanine--poly(phosphoribitol) ligase subunit 2